MRKPINDNWAFLFLFIVIVLYVVVMGYFVWKAIEEVNKN